MLTRLVVLFDGCTWLVGGGCCGLLWLLFCWFVLVDWFYYDSFCFVVLRGFGLWLFVDFVGCLNVVCLLIVCLRLFGFLSLFYLLYLLFGVMVC